MMRKQLLCMIFGGLFLISSVIAGPLEEMRAADAIIIHDTEEQKDLIKQKCVEYARLASKESSLAGVLSQLRMAIIHHNGLFGYPASKSSAMPYWIALTNQTIDPSMRVLGFEMVGHYHKEGWESVGVKVAPNPGKAQEYLQRAYNECAESDVKGHLFTELQLLGQRSEVCG